MKRRYTLVELLVVVIIIGILAGLVIPAVGSARQRARESSCAAGCATLMQALKSFENDYQRFPCDMETYNSTKGYTPIGGGVRAQSYTTQDDFPPSALASAATNANRVNRYDYTMGILTGYVGGAGDATSISTDSSNKFGRNRKKTRYFEPPENYLKPSTAVITNVCENGFYANAFGERYYLVWDTEGRGNIRFKRPSSDAVPSSANIGFGNIDTDNDADYTTTIVATVAVFCSVAPYDTTTNSEWAKAERIATSWGGVITNSK